MSENRTFRLTCPECSADLVVDATTGEILYHKPAKRAPAQGKSFDGLMQDLDEGKARAEEIFERERAAMKDRDRLLEERFKEAMRRAEDLDDDNPPLRPFDLD